MTRRKFKFDGIISDYRSTCCSRYATGMNGLDVDTITYISKKVIHTVKNIDAK